MNAEVYQTLPVNHRAEILWSKGEFIGGREEKDFDVSLYEIDGVYVEMFYSVTSNQIEDVKVVFDEKCVRRYR